MMDRWCWRRVALLFFGALLVCGGLQIAGIAQDMPTDMSVTEISVTPVSGAIQGDTIHIVTTLGFVGPAPSAGVSVEITWRRIDQQAPCGVIVETTSE